jgi:4-diphosphocytidyl-2-C-methyl-D-erythritol kinase
VAAGLGGGSSDAAATLCGLNDLFGRPLLPEELSVLGLELGADVPFFIDRRPAAWAGGIGEVLKPAPDLENLYVLLVNPGWSLSTAWVYKKFNFELTKKRQKHIFCGLLERSFTIEECMENDLETVVLPRFPELRQIKDMLIAAGARGALMSGSGPTMFGIFSDEDKLEAAAKGFNQAGRGRWLVLATHSWTDKD